MSAPPIPNLQAVGVGKKYSSTVALDDVNVTFDGGRIHALLGKNGAGKSTLIKIFAGAIQPTSGKLLVGGREVHLDSPADAFKQGIATVHQELSLIPDLTVAENILLGRLPRKRTLGVRGIDWAETFRKGQALLDEMHAGIDARQKARELGVAQQQVVEIAKAMSFQPRALLLDEPTSALSQHEIDRLYILLRRLAGSGVAIIYITHRLSELRQIADTITVLRDGRLVGSAPFDQLDSRRIVQMMFGDISPKERPANVTPTDRPVLQVSNLGSGSRLDDVSFTLRAGEILGVAGMLGSGRSELLRAIFGADRLDRGRMVLHGKAFHPATPSQARDLGVALVPENRKEQGLVLPLSTRANFFLASLTAMAPYGISSRRKERTRAADLIDQLAIKLPNLESPVGMLSGGNQQKVVVGKWLNTQPRVILFDEPTRGIDLAAKQQLFSIIWDLSRQGIACMMVSSELEELIEVCHRILILKNGRVTEEVRADDLSANDLWLRCMSE